MTNDEHSQYSEANMSVQATQESTTTTTPAVSLLVSTCLHCDQPCAQRPPFDAQMYVGLMYTTTKVYSSFGILAVFIVISYSYVGGLPM